MSGSAPPDQPSTCPDRTVTVRVGGRKTPTGPRANPSVRKPNTVLLEVRGRLGRIPTRVPTGHLSILPPHRVRPNSSPRSLKQPPPHNHTTTDAHRKGHGGGALWPWPCYLLAASSAPFNISSNQATPNSHSSFSASIIYHNQLKGERSAHPSIQIRYGTTTWQIQLSEATPPTTSADTAPANGNQHRRSDLPWPGAYQYREALVDLINQRKAI